MAVAWPIGERGMHSWAQRRPPIGANVRFYHSICRQCGDRSRAARLSIVAIVSNGSRTHGARAVHSHAITSDSLNKSKQTTALINETHVKVIVSYKIRIKIFSVECRRSGFLRNVDLKQRSGFRATSTCQRSLYEVNEIKLKLMLALFEFSKVISNVIELATDLLVFMFVRRPLLDAQMF